MSHPLWVCGLKSEQEILAWADREVTPFMGVWIEIRQMKDADMMASSHTLYGCVD